MTEQHFNNGKTLLDNRNRIKGLKERMQGDGNISLLDEIKSSDSKIYVQIRDFSKELLEKEEARLQSAFDDLKETELTLAEKMELEKKEVRKS